MAGLGHRLPPSRCKQVKRTWKRACRRAVRDGHTQYRGKTLWAYEIPMRFRIFAPSDEPPKPVSKPRTVSTASDLGVFSWNAGNGLICDEWILWRDQSGYDTLLIQEIGWIFSNQWQTHNWMCIHTAHQRASQLLMIRRVVISSDEIAYNAFIPGRLVHLRLMFKYIHDIFNVYQFAWNTTRDPTDLTQARAELWTRLDESVRHTPRRHMLLVAGDFNTPLDRIDPFVCTSDAKFSRSLQEDKHIFQALFTDLRLVAIHCNRHTFLHGSRATRIDFMFMREHQIRWQKLKAHIHCRFECTLDVLGPIHRPLIA